MTLIDKLTEYGVNAKEGLDRCMNNEELYFRLLNKALNDDSILRLKEKLEEKDFDEAFKISHSLKGVLGNLSITPMYGIVYEMTEELRTKKDIDYKGYIDKLLKIREELVLLINK